VNSTVSMMPARSGRMTTDSSASSCPTRSSSSRMASGASVTASTTIGGGPDG
jgi:hypothetical protein